MEPIESTSNHVCETADADVYVRSCNVSLLGVIFQQYTIHDIGSYPSEAKRQKKETNS